MIFRETTGEKNYAVVKVSEIKFFFFLKIIISRVGQKKGLK